MDNSFLTKTNHIFCIYGQLDDMIFANNLRKMSFNEFLSEYLRRVVGFKKVVYLVSNRGVRVYDDESAEIIAQYREFSEDDYSDGDRDELLDDEDDWEDDFVWSNPIPSQVDSGLINQAEKTSQETSPNVSGVYSNIKVAAKDVLGNKHYNAKLERTDMIDMIDQYIKNPQEKICFVFENIDDYNDLNQTEGKQIRSTITYLLHDAMDDNQNRIIFLGTNQTVESLYNLFHQDDILSAVFFQESKNSYIEKEEVMFLFDYPRRDEISNLLEYYRIIGVAGDTIISGRKYLEYEQEQLDTLTWALEYMMIVQHNVAKHERFTINRLNELITSWMRKKKSQFGNKISFTVSEIQEMFPSIILPEPPLERLENMRLYEIYYRMKYIKKKYKQIQSNNYEIKRFVTVELGNRINAKFLICGYENTRRSIAAKCIADCLYKLGIVSGRTPFRVDESDYLQINVNNAEQYFRSCYRRAYSRILIFDDLDKLLDIQNGQQIVHKFHKVLLEEISYNNNQAIIFVVNESKKEEFFDRYMEKYGFLEEQVFKMSEPIKELIYNDTQKMDRIHTER